MPLSGILYATETGTKPTGHHILETHLAGGTRLTGIARHRHHHRLRTTDGNTIEALLLQKAMLSDEATLALGAILCGDKQTPLCMVFLCLDNVFRRTETQQKGRLQATLAQATPQIEKGCNSYPTANKQHTLPRRLRHCEAMSQRQNCIQHIARLHRREVTGTVANGLNKEPNFILLTVNIVYADGTPQERSGTAIYAQLSKLTRQHFGQRSLGTGSPQQVVTLAKSFDTYEPKV